MRTPGNIDPACCPLIYNSETIVLVLTVEACRDCRRFVPQTLRGLPTFIGPNAAPTDHRSTGLYDRYIHLYIYISFCI